MREQDSTKMEFLLTLNDNIVVQRFFNVRGLDSKNGSVLINKLDFWHLKSSNNLTDF